MKKLILKTIVAALLSIFSIFLVLFGTLSLTVPQWMGKLAGNLGLVQTEATYALQAYKKDKKIESLSIAVQKSYNAKLYQNSATYGRALIEDENFATYCQTQPEYVNALSKFTTKVFLQAITAESCFYIGDADQTFIIAQSTYIPNNDYQVVDWLLELPKIQADTNFYNQLQTIKTTR